jgi:hypothetical protein
MRPSIERHAIFVVRVAVFLVLLSLLSSITYRGPLAQKKPGELSESAKRKIAEALDRQPVDALALFNLQGEFKRGVRLLKAEELGRYRSLREFVVENSPVDTCKNPVPSPPCVICDDGSVLCTRANFSGKPGKALM